MADPDVLIVDEIRSIFCLKNREDMERIEEEEDCFILDFDPFEHIQLCELSINSPEDEDADLVVVAEKGKVACRDYPHPRHLCAKYPFDKTSHEKHCEKCYCVICNEPAPCKQWDEPLNHCSATHRLDVHFKATSQIPIGGVGIRSCN
ncbi:hypothetical protein V2J09_005756 [Rumex salicifolius]